MNHVEFLQGRHSSRSCRYFPNLPIFLRADVLDCFYGSNWYSFLMAEGDHCFAHVVVPSLVSDTGYFDSEPWLGYQGFLSTSTDNAFLRKTLDRYSQECRQHRIVCEYIRFEPLLANDVPFHSLTSSLKFSRHKPIVYLKLLQNPEHLIQLYSGNARRIIVAAQRAGYEAKELDKDLCFHEFIDLYSTSMTKASADANWHFNQETWAKLRKLSVSSLWGVRDPSGALISACLVLSNQQMAYYFLGANADLGENKGVNHLLVHHVASVFGANGLSWLSLGGGRTSDPDDALLFFKRRFSKQTFPLPIGFFVHDESTLSRWNAVASNASTIFLRYRLEESFAKGRFEATNLPSVHTGGDAPVCLRSSLIT